MTLAEPLGEDVPSAHDAVSAPGSAAPASGWRAHWLSGLLLVGAVLVPLVSYVGQLGLAPLAAVMGLACLPLLGRRAPPSLGIGLLLLLVVWELVSMTWSVAAPVHPDFHRYKSVEALTGLKLVFELALYGALTVSVQSVAPESGRRAMLVLAIGLCLMCGVMSLDAVTQGEVYRGLRRVFHQKDQLDLIRRNAARGCYTAALLFWPAMLRLGQSHLRVWQAVLAVGFVVAAVGLQVDAPVVALIVGSLVFVAVRRFGRGAIWALLGLTVIYFALTPLLIDLIFRAPAGAPTGASVVKASWFARVDIWRFVANLIPAHPAIGWGMDASRMWPNLIPLHPHNAALQIWLELGAVAAGIVILFWSWLWERIARLCDLDRTSGAAAASVAAAYLVIGALSFGVWQEWWLGLGALALVFCIALTAGREGYADLHSGELTELVPLS